MGDKTGISWADRTANLWMGCAKVSPACDRCYAERVVVGRFKRELWGPKAERARVKAGWENIPRWERAAQRNGGLAPDLGRRADVFVNSWSDFFEYHLRVGPWRAEGWDLIRSSPSLNFFLLTKRSNLIARELPDFWDEIAPRVALMTTAENQEEANRRVPDLLASTTGRADPAFFGVSVEPMLGYVDLRRWLSPRADGQSVSPRLGYVICGGESGGRKARPLHPMWVDDLQEQCATAGTVFHFKQWGEWSPYSPVGIESKRLIAHPDTADEALIRQRCDEGLDGIISWPMNRVGVKYSSHRIRGGVYQPRGPWND